jgi:NAD(P)-dependent dehydrogenase (short-subunit alcohol dehydrogenase family)
MTDDWLGLRGRRAVVGGVGGIGLEIAREFAVQGSRLVLIDGSKQRLRAAEATVGATGAQVQTVVADLSSEPDAEAAIEAACDALGGIDVFVHAVGVNDRRPILELPADAWQRVLETNLTSAFWTGRAVGRLMNAQRHGRIVYLSSVSGLLAHKHHGPYAASKGGLNQLMRVMAREWAECGVTVNAIAPGYTETDLTSEYLARPGVRDEMVGWVPAGRLGSVTDVVGSVLFLASDRAAFITGQVLYVDGGRTLA